MSCDDRCTGLDSTLFSGLSRAYCVGFKLNAALDQLRTLRKMVVYDRLDSRFTVLPSNGNQGRVCLHRMILNNSIIRHESQAPANA